MINRLENEWVGWKDDPCSDTSTSFLVTLMERLNWAETVHTSMQVESSFGHAGNLQEILERSEKIRTLKLIIAEIVSARASMGCE